VLGHYTDYTTPSTNSSNNLLRVLWPPGGFALYGNPVVFEGWLRVVVNWGLWWLLFFWGGGGGGMAVQHLLTSSTD
jgi:hypothetical protein